MLTKPKFLSFSATFYSVCVLLCLSTAGTATAQETPIVPMKGDIVIVDAGSKSGDPDPERRRRFNEFNQFYAYGKEMMLKGKLDEALRAFQHAKEVYPEAHMLGPYFGEVYMRKGMWREAEAAYREDIKKYGYSNGWWQLARYGLVELYLGNLPEAYKAYEKAREKHELAKPNLPVLIPSEQTQRLEACLRFLMAGEGMGITREEQAAELKKVIALSPHLLLAEYEYVHVVLWKQYEKDRAGYLKAARPYLEDVARYAVGDLQKNAQSRLHALYGTPLKTEPKP